MLRTFFKSTLLATFKYIRGLYYIFNYILIVVTMLCLRVWELIYFIARSLYPVTIISPFPSSCSSWQSPFYCFKVWLKKKIYFAALCLSCGTGDLHCLMYDLCCSMWDLVPWPGIEPGPPALEAKSLSHWTTREVPKFGFFFFKDTTDKWDHTVYVFFCLIYFT